MFLCFNPKSFKLFSCSIFIMNCILMHLMNLRSCFSAQPHTNISSTYLFQCFMYFMYLLFPVNNFLSNSAIKISDKVGDNGERMNLVLFVTFVIEYKRILFKADFERCLKCTFSFVIKCTVVNVVV